MKLTFLAFSLNYLFQLKKIFRVHFLSPNILHSSRVFAGCYVKKLSVFEIKYRRKKNLNFQM